MWLIDVETHKLSDFSLSTVPPYAILSHTWGEDEVTFQEFTAGRGREKAGYEKIAKMCQLAEERGLEWAWVDTCCIDKSSSAELTEAINSMYAWYRNSEVCFVWLEDLEPGRDIRGALPSCRWLYRGWTLQELLAPRVVEFYNRSWAFEANKWDLRDELSEITCISVDALLDAESMSRCSVAQKMSWAAARSTTRLEDAAYCLLGIFDVNMPLIYGEGEKAFRRLQEEIVKRSSDLTILAWKNEMTPEMRGLSVFAASPVSFLGCDRAVPFWDDLASFSITQRGLVMDGGLGSPPLRLMDIAVENKDDDKDSHLTYVLMFGKINMTIGGIALRKIGPGIFCRDSRYPLLGSVQTAFAEVKVLHHPGTYCILNLGAQGRMPLSLESLLYGYRLGCVRLLHERNDFSDFTAPTYVFDDIDRVFLNTSLYGSEIRRPYVLAMRLAVAIEESILPLIGICRFGKNGVSHTALVQEDDIVITSTLAPLFKGHGDESMMWWDMTGQYPDLNRRNSYLHVARRQTVYKVSLSFHSDSEEFRANYVRFGMSDAIVPRIEVTKSEHEGRQCLDLDSILPGPIEQ